MVRCFAGRRYGGPVYLRDNGMERFQYPTWMGKYPRRNTPWTNEECRLLVKAFTRGDTKRQIAKFHGRTEGSIDSKLMGLLGRNFYVNDNVDRAKYLTAVGYCRISNKHNIISRIDRPDWLILLAKYVCYTVEEMHNPDGEINITWANYYRRVFSEDKLSVDKYVFKLIPPSNGGPTKYISKGTEYDKIQNS